MRIAAITMTQILPTPVIQQHNAARRLPGPQSWMPVLTPERFLSLAACLHLKTDH
jgi:hypothetical protein